MKLITIPLCAVALSACVPLVTGEHGALIHITTTKTNNCDNSSTCANTGSDVDGALDAAVSASLAP